MPRSLYHFFKIAENVVPQNLIAEKFELPVFIIVNIERKANNTTHNDNETNKGTNEQANKQSNEQANKQTNKHTHTHTHMMMMTMMTTTTIRNKI